MPFTDPLPDRASITDETSSAELITRTRNKRWEAKISRDWATWLRALAGSVVTVNDLPGGGGGGNPSPLDYLDLTEQVAPAPGDPAADTARLHALDANGFTVVEVRDGNANVVRLASDNVVIGKVSQSGGIARGQIVYLKGATGANPLLGLARADDLATLPAIGMALDPGANNAFIRVLLGGTLQLLNTAGFPEGARLFVSPTIAGDATTTLPVAPNFAQRVGIVTRSHATQGEVLILTTSIDGPPRHHGETHSPGGTDPLMNAAWLDQYNIFSKGILVSRANDYTPGPNQAELALEATNWPPGERRWRLVSDSSLLFQAVNEAETASSTTVQIDRDGTISVSGIGRVAHEKRTNIFTRRQFIEFNDPDLIFSDVTIADPDQRYFRICNATGGKKLLFQAVNQAVTALTDGMMTLDRHGNITTTGNIAERSRAVPMGEWTQYTPVVSFGAGMGMTGGEISGKYAQVGKTVLLAFNISATIFSGFPATQTEVQISLPPGIVYNGPGAQVASAINIYNGTTWGWGMVYIQAGDGAVRCYGTFNNAVGYIWGSLTFPMA